MLPWAPSEATPSPGILAAGSGLGAGALTAGGCGGARVAPCTKTPGSCVWARTGMGNSKPVSPAATMYGFSDDECMTPLQQLERSVASFVSVGVNEQAAGVGRGGGARSAELF